MTAKSPLYYAKALLGVALVVIVAPFALAAELFARARRRTAAEATGAAADWDDFTSVLIADPALEALRHEAIALPITPDGRKTLDGLRARAEALL